ncbi:MAG: DUF1616 domain-containing protein [Chloroflexota bacterium]
MLDLLLVAILSLALVPVAILTTGPVRIVISLPFLLFFPGYVLLSALFTRKADISGAERLILSFGMSTAVVPLIGVILNYSPLGVRLYPVLISLLAYILLMTAIAWNRRRQAPASDRFEPAFSYRLRNLLRLFSAGQPDRVLNILLAISMTAAVGTFVFAAVNPKIGERFTEFYVLGGEGKAAGYPSKLTLGQEGRVILGIANQELETVHYRADIIIQGKKVAEVGPIVLSHGQKWEREVGFTPGAPDMKQKVQFLLYKGNGREPYREVHLWVDVTLPPEQEPPEPPAKTWDEILKEIQEAARKDSAGPRPEDWDLLPFQSE